MANEIYAKFDRTREINALRIEMAAVSGLVLLACYFVVTTFSWGLTLDAPVTHYIAARMIAGDVPYRDIFDNNLPVAYWIDYFVIKYFGGGDLAWRLADLAALGLICSLLYATLARLDRLAGVLVACLVALFHFSSGPDGVGERDFFLLLPLSAFALIYDRILDSKDHSRWALFVSGGLIGISVFLKPTFIIVLAVFSIHLLVLGRFSRRSVIDVTAFAAGSATVAGIVLAQLAATGALEPFFIIQIDFVMRSYARIRLPFNPLRVARAALFVLPIGIAAIGLTIRDGKCHRVGLIFGALAAIGALHYILQGKFFPYHLYPGTVFAIAASGAGLAALRRSPLGHLRFLRSMVFVLAAVTSVAFFAAVKPELFKWANWQPPRSVVAIENDLRSLGEAGRVVQPLDVSNGALDAMYVVGSRTPTRFIYGFPFFQKDNPSYIRSIRAELISGLEAAGYPPIVLYKRLSTRLGSWNPEAANSDIASWWPEFADFLARDYQIYLDREIDTKTDEGIRGYLIYIRKIRK
jgi:Dolichyl-phosphate-mannose-protein mannosyltransferase